LGTLTAVEGLDQLRGRFILGLGDQMRLVTGLATIWFAASSVMAQPITIVSYNAENLFDTEDDLSNPRDDTYLPLAVKDQNRQAHGKSCRCRG
jgi:hypothetical protein